MRFKYMNIFIETLLSCLVVTSDCCIHRTKQGKIKVVSSPGLGKFQKLFCLS